MYCMRGCASDDRMGVLLGVSTRLFAIEVFRSSTFLLLHATATEPDRVLVCVCLLALAYRRHSQLQLYSAVCAPCAADGVGVHSTCIYTQCRDCCRCRLLHVLKGQMLHVLPSKVTVTVPLLAAPSTAPPAPLVPLPHAAGGDGSDCIVCQTNGIHSTGTAFSSLLPVFATLADCSVCGRDASVVLLAPAEK